MQSPFFVVLVAVDGPLRTVLLVLDQTEHLDGLEGITRAAAEAKTGHAWTPAIVAS